MHRLPADRDGRAREGPRGRRQRDEGRQDENVEPGGRPLGEQGQQTVRIGLRRGESVVHFPSGADQGFTHEGLSGVYARMKPFSDRLDLTTLIQLGSDTTLDPVSPA
jgi:hypothetical protein